MQSIHNTRRDPATFLEIREDNTQPGYRCKSNLPQCFFYDEVKYKRKVIWLGYRIVVIAIGYSAPSYALCSAHR